MRLSQGALWQAQGAAGVAAALFGAGGLFAATWVASPEVLAFLDQRLASMAATTGQVHPF